MEKLNEYQKAARDLNIYPKGHMGLLAHALGLANEGGEVLGKLKKTIRDNNCQFVDEELRKNIKSELGDTLWYLSNLANDFQLTLEEVAQYNIDKLLDRKARGKLQGSGDNR